MPRASRTSEREDPRGRWCPSAEEERDQMLRQVTDLVTTRRRRTPTGSRRPRTCSAPGSTARAAHRYQINTYWRDGMCEHAHVEGPCPSAPGEALIDPTMLRTIDAKVGDEITVVYTGFGGEERARRRLSDRPTRSSAPTRSTTTPRPTGSTPATPAATALLRPPSARLARPRRRRPRCWSTRRRSRSTPPPSRARTAPIDLDALDIATMDDAEVAARDLADLDRRPGPAGHPAETT